jgi:hypothetical protein
MEKTEYRLDMTVMLATHDALRRDLARATGLSRRSTGWDLFERFLHVHHTAEDDALWPAVRRHVADHAADLALLEEMAAEHARIEPVLAAIDERLGTSDAGAKADELVRELDAELGQHLDHEEREALPLIDRTLTEEEWVGFADASSKVVGADGARFFPWLLDGADEETTGRVLGTLPPPVQDLYRTEWLPAYAEHVRWDA